MLAKSQLQYSIDDWLQLHHFTAYDVRHYCHLITHNCSFLIKQIKQKQAKSEKSLRLNFEQSLEYLVLPSIQMLLDLDDHLMQQLSKVEIIRHKPSDLKQPYTEYNSQCKMPVIHLCWSNSPSDLICLSHEMAHAAHMLLSNNTFSAPVYRETCAFLGELSLIQYARGQSDALYQELCVVWQEENQGYLDNDVQQLSDALETTSATYTYRHNYPLARVAAIWLYASQSKDLMGLFISKAATIEWLDFPKIMAAFQQHGAYQTDDDIIGLSMSLSPVALQEVRTGQIDYAWLYQPAKMGCIIDDKQIEEKTAFSPQTWIKWRSLGVIALALLNKDKADLLPGRFLEIYEQAALQLPPQNFSLLMPWLRPLAFDALTALGMAIQQLAVSPYHQQFKLVYYLPVEILPPLRIKQLYCYVNQQGNPIGMVSWAWLSDEVKQDVHTTGRALQHQDWSTGSHLFCNDWITTQSSVFRTVVAHMAQDMFPDEIGSSLRRNSDGSVRRVNKWLGRNQRQTSVISKE